MEAPQALEPGSEMWQFFQERYDAIRAAVLAQDAEAFVAAFGPDATFVARNGETIRFDATTDFWEWRFGPPHEQVSSTMRVTRVEEIEPGEWAVEFHEESMAVVVTDDGRRIERTADLHNRNFWRLGSNGISAFGAGEELSAHRTLAGEPLTDDADDPVGFAAWAARHA